MGTPENDEVSAGVEAAVGEALALDPVAVRKEWRARSLSTNPKDLIGITKPGVAYISNIAIFFEGVVMALGAVKYGAFNWRKSKVQASIYYDAARRHMDLWYDGEDDDIETKVSHLASARANLGILIDAMELGMLIDDRPKSGKLGAVLKRLTK